MNKYFFIAGVAIFLIIIHSLSKDNSFCNTEGYNNDGLKVKVKRYTIIRKTVKDSYVVFPQKYFAGEAVFVPINKNVIFGKQADDGTRTWFYQSVNVPDGMFKMVLYYTSLQTGEKKIFLPAEDISDIEEFVTPLMHPRDMPNDNVRFGLKILDYDHYEKELAEYQEAGDTEYSSCVEYQKSLGLTGREIQKRCV